MMLKRSHATDITNMGQINYYFLQCTNEHAQPLEYFMWEAPECGRVTDCTEMNVETSSKSSSATVSLNEIEVKVEESYDISEGDV